MVLLAHLDGVNLSLDKNWSFTNCDFAVMHCMDLSHGVRARQMRPKPLTNEAEATAKLFEPKWRRLCDLPRGTVSSPIALERMPTVCLSKVAGDMLERNELATACLKNSENPQNTKLQLRCCW